MKNNLEELPFPPGKFFIADNYPEAVGIMTALRAGVTLSSVRRPLSETKVSYEREKYESEPEVVAPKSPKIVTMVDKRRARSQS